MVYLLLISFDALFKTNDIERIVLIETLLWTTPMIDSVKDLEK
jgi:hypothetical protein